MRQIYKTLVRDSFLISVGYWLSVIKSTFHLYFGRYVRLFSLRLRYLTAPLRQTFSEAQEGRGKLSVLQLEKFKKDGEVFLFLEGPLGVIFALSMFLFIGAFSILFNAGGFDLDEGDKTTLFTIAFFSIFVAGIYITLHLKIKEEYAKPALKYQRDLDIANQVEHMMTNWENLRDRWFKWSFFAVLATYWTMQNGWKFFIATCQEKGLLKKPTVPVVKNFNLRDKEIEMINEALKLNNYRYKETAETLGIDVYSLDKRIKRHGIVVIRPLDGWWRELREKSLKRESKPRQKNVSRAHAFSES